MKPRIPGRSLRSTLRTTLAAALAVAALATVAAPVAARTKLVTLPERASLVVNLQNPDYSMLYEEREITLQQGNNDIDFSWQGVSIDPASIHLSILTNPGDGPTATKLVNLSMPPGESALTWNLFSPEARTEKIRVSYLLSGLTRETSYEFTVNAEETQARLQQFFKLGNTSGEDLEDANLRIAQAEDWTRSIKAGETRRFLAADLPALPLKKLYIARPAPFSTRGEEGEEIALVYELRNDKASGLGTYLLEFGKARLFSADPDGSTLFLGEDMLQATAVGERAELALGTVKDVLLKRRIQGDKRENERKDRYQNVVLYDRVVHVRYEIENFKDKAAQVRVVEQLPPDAVIVEGEADGVKVTRKSGNELELDIDLVARPADPKTKVPVREVNLVYRVPNVIP